jgi:hypothetical protein
VNNRTPHTTMRQPTDVQTSERLAVHLHTENTKIPRSSQTLSTPLRRPAVRPSKLVRNMSQVRPDDFSRPAVEAPSHPDAQTSRRLNVQASRPPDVRTLSSLDAQTSERLSVRFLDRLCL